MTNTITTFTGRETHREGSSNAGVHVLVGRSVEPLATLVKDGAISDMRLLGKPLSITSREGYNGDMVGSWVTRSIDIPDGIPLLLRWRRGEEHGCHLLMCRRGYPFLRVAYPTVAHPKATRSWVGLTGRCRTVSPEELAAKGIRLPAAILALLEPGRRCLRPADITKIEPGFIAEPEIIEREIVIEGEAKRIVAARRRRKIEV